VAHSSKQREVKETLKLIKTELEENLENLHWVQHRLVEEQKAYILLQQNINAIEKIPEDTLQKYYNVIGAIHSTINKTDAYEVFKSSLLMQYVQDKDFLRKLINTYEKLQLINTKVTRYSDLKGVGIKQLMETIELNDLELWTHGGIYDFFRVTLKYKAVRSFIYTGTTILDFDIFEGCKQEIQSMIEELNQRI
jgi:hypothetical protein